MKLTPMKLDSDISEYEKRVAAILESNDPVEQKKERLNDGIESILWVSLRSLCDQHNHSFDGLTLERFEESDIAYHLEGTAYWLDTCPTNYRFDISKSKPQDLYSIKLLDTKGTQVLYLARSQDGWASAPDAYHP